MVRRVSNVFWVVLASISVAVSTGSEAAQAAKLQQPVVGQSLKQDLSPPLRDIPVIRPPVPPVEEAAREIPLHRIPRPVGPKVPVKDPLLQYQPVAPAMPAPVQNFAGVKNADNLPDSALPPDTNGDVGPNHYVQMVNLSFAIWDKSGTLLYGPAANNTLWNGFGGPCETSNDGDPIVLYDQQADRWLMSQFALPNYPSGPFYQCIAISQTGDPTAAWYRHAFLVHATKMNDYPKFGVWPDGYYMSVNQFDPGWAGAGVFVFHRANMLAGSPATFQYFDLAADSLNWGGLLPSDWDGSITPPAGAPNYFVSMDDDAWGYSPDSLHIWEFHVDWVTPANSTLTGPTQLATAAFDSNLCGYSNCIPQQGTARKLDPLSDRLMHRLQYRKFGSYEAMVTNHTADVDGTNHAGIRWYELRNTGSGWSINQQGTYAPDAAHRWMGSIAMDSAGNMALGYSVSSDATYPSIRYTGRLAGDPLGTLPQGEATLIAGSGSQTSLSGRWGDYSMMAVDPTDDCTFWYTTEYYTSTSVSNWKTRIGSFAYSSCTGGGSNNPPNTPSNPNPANGATGVSTTPTLSWTGGDPDVGDTVTYDVYFGTAASPPLVSSNQAAATFAPGTLTASTLYYWRIVARDSFGATTSGPTWSFTTGTSGGASCQGTGVYRFGGIVRTASLAAISGTTMTLTGPGGCTDTTTTNSLGRYRFQNLAPGTYTVTPAPDTPDPGCAYSPISATKTITTRHVNARFTGNCP